MVRVQRPENALSTSYTATDLFYDGVRCVQEAGWVRVPARTVQATQANALGNGGATDGSGGAGALILTTLYIHKLPQRASYFAQDGTGTGTNTTTAVPNVLGMRRLEREYVYAMDPGAYVDEVVAQLVYTDAHRATGPPAGLGGTGAGDDGGAEIEEIPGSNSSQSLVTPAGEFGDDRTPTLVYVLTDSNQNVVGLADSGGRLVASYEYSPYGVVKGARYFAADSSLISQEARAAARTSRLGHQGLRFERFDRPWRGGVSNATTDVPGDGAAAVVGAVFEPELADIGPGTPSAATLALADGLPGFDGVYHNRNRMYDPENGRFIEVDPRGLGLPVLDDLSYNGSGFTPVDVSPDIRGHFGDGQSAQIAYGSGPLRVRDATGLFYALDVGASIGGILSDLVTRYSENLSDDAEWAEDWSRGDNDYSRLSSRWVVETLAQSAYNQSLFADADAIGELYDAAVDGLSEQLTPFFAGDVGDQAMAGIIRQTIIKGGKVIRKGHWHHALPKYLAKWFNKSSKVLVKLDKRLHGKYHQALDAALRGIDVPAMNSPGRKWENYLRQFKGDRVALKREFGRIKETMRRVTEEFEHKNGLQGMVEALEESFNLAE